MIYLDHAATAPVPEEVAQTVYRALLDNGGNPSSQYEPGRAAAQKLAEDRAVIAGALGCSPTRLFFTSCGSESDNWAIEAALWQNRHVGKHILTTAVEHSAVLQKCKDLEKQGFEITYLSPDSSGRISLQQVKDALQEDTALVSMMLVNNETGNVFPVAEVAKLLKEQKSAALLHCDAVQGFLEVPFTVRTLGADLIAVSGHKIGAPKGIGALYLSERLRAPRPLIFGGGQESTLRGGTEATAQIAGFAEAVRLRTAQPQAVLAHMETIKAYAKRLLSRIPDLVWVGESQAPHILAFSLPGYPSQNIVNDLSDHGICISAGSACHKGQPSHVFKAMGLSKKVAIGTVRISFGPETGREEIDALCSALIEHKNSRFPML